MIVLLLSNYPPDRQQSMLRFAGVLERELPAAGCTVRRIWPEKRLARLTPERGGLAKWLGYADKFLLFPQTLRREVELARGSGKSFVVHVCDHSNAIYARHLQNVPHLVTCNDLLAVRSALGEFPENPTRWSGRRLQGMILDGLRRARRIAAISEATRRDVLRVAALPAERVERIYMGLNHPYTRMDADAARQILTQRKLAALVNEPFLLHVGGNQWYKNRLGALRIYAELRRTGLKPKMLFAGELFTEAMRQFISAGQLEAHVFELTGCDNETLCALYSQAAALLFPSLAEGFGWPVIEAQACGCPVATSDRAPLTEVGGDAAVYLPPDHPARAATLLAGLLAEDATASRQRREHGLANVARFTTARMVADYARLYRELAA